ncbi:GNAT family protein [Halobacillus sp. HZG1]|nr:GNAT family protein [Halobacillus sp. HZG1]
MYFPPMETERLHLVHVSQKHTNFILNHFSNSKVCEFLYDEEDLENYDQALALVQWFSNPEEKGYNRWVLESKEKGGIPLGTCGFHLWDRQNRMAEIGYDLYPDYWGKGLMKEALVACINSGFQNMNLNRIHAYVAVENQRSSDLLNRLGFTCEGVFRDKHYYQGRYYDHYTYSLLRREW